MCKSIELSAFIIFFFVMSSDHILKDTSLEKKIHSLRAKTGTKLFWTKYGTKQLS